MNAIPSELDDHRYWKAAISHLPTQMQRDAAWEFFINRFVGNPNTADTISGVVMVMEAHGLYMLALPRKFHDEAVTPLATAMSQFHEDSLKLLEQQEGANRATLDACEKAQETAKSAADAVTKLDEAIRQGWQEVKTDKLTERIQRELEQTVFHPLSAQCGRLEEVAPIVTAAVDQLVKSASKLRAFHFRGIILAIVLSSLAIVGVYLWKLNKDFDLKSKAALEALHNTNSINREAYEKLDSLGARIRVIGAKDERGNPVPDHYALVMDAGYDVVVRDSPKGKQAGLFFRSLDLKERMKQLLEEKADR